MWPKAHSGRSSLTPLLMKMGLKSQILTVFMRWKHGSSMISRYQGETLECSDKGAAHALKKAIDEGKIDTIEQVNYSKSLTYQRPDNRYFT